VRVLMISQSNLLSCVVRYEQRGGGFPNRGYGGGHGGGPMNQAPRASPWANGPPGGMFLCSFLQWTKCCLARAYGAGMGGGGGYRDNMDAAIREQREQLAMQQQLLQQQEYIR
jgi:hypothetical protein